MPGSDSATGADAAVTDAGLSSDSATVDTGADAGGTSDAGLCATPIAPLPVAMYAMIDQSSSMLDPVGGGTTRWDALTQAIDAYLGGAGASVSFGLSYFGVPATGTCPATCLVDRDCGPCGPCNLGFCLGSGGDSCTAADYATPAVEIGSASSVASGVHTSLASHGPSTGTPTSAALQGAVDHAASYAGAHADQYVIALLVTDGDPTECDTSTANIDAIAAGALTGAQHVPTAVLSLGAGPAFANGLAAAGGTGSAQAPDLSSGASAQIVAALDAIASARCALAIPAGADPATLTLQSHDGASVVPLPHRADAGACAGSAGFYFDDASAPHRALLCPASCTALGASSSMVIERVSGC